MPNLNEPSFIKQQYATSQNLENRITLHERFSTHTQDWHRWIWDHMTPGPQANVLELGCGTGLLWSKNRERIPASWHIALMDLSLGMLQTTAKLQLPVQLVQSDAQSIPFGRGSFHAVIANHMLYHVPDLDKALGEIRRVLKPGGKLYAATNGLNHMRQVKDLILDVFQIEAGQPVLSFALENGHAKLARHFRGVTRYDMEDSLVVTETEPLVDYIFSLRLASFRGDAEKEARLRDAIAARIARDGAFHIEKSPCLFEASAE